MLTGFFRAVFLSPFYGLVVAISAIPVLIVTTFAFFMLNRVGMVLPPTLVMLVVGFLGALFAQSARYAASKTGLRAITDQPSQTEGIMRSLSSTFLVTAIACAIIIARLGNEVGADSIQGFMSFDMKAFFGSLGKVLNVPIAPEQTLNFSPAEKPFFIKLIAAAVFVTFVCMLITPRSTGLEEGFERAHSMGMITARFAIAMPFCLIATNVIVSMLLSGANAVLGAFGLDFAMTIGSLLFINMIVFTGMIFTFEGYLLQIGRAIGDHEKSREQRIMRDDSRDLRALREAWSRSG